MIFLTQYITRISSSTIFTTGEHFPIREKNEVHVSDTQHQSNNLGISWKLSGILVFDPPPIPVFIPPELEHAFKKFSSRPLDF